jgi:hypothetical protein
MKRIMAVAALCACAATTLAGQGHEWVPAFQPFTGRYSIYGGGLGDPTAPTNRSKNIAFSVSGKVAKQMFEAMGPDLKDACGSGDGNRIRQRAEVDCSFHPKSGYQCNFGFDLVSGRSIGGSIC